MPMRYLGVLAALLLAPLGALADDQITVNGRAAYERYLEFDSMVDGGFVDPRWSARYARDAMVRYFVEHLNPGHEPLP